ncbi:MAG: hypothetical protein EOQ55_17225 [Mesorhizobium sp.]|nr:MAG: hypothetical protein EOQ55_17225 [Mesorhizobium sp.]
MQTLLKFLSLIVLIAFGAASATGALAQEQKRLAFVIGNGAYQSGELATAANDAGLIAQTLQAAGFDVVGARDVDQDSLRGALRDFLGKVSAAGPDAVVFVYLAGHGVQFEGENYFLPVDAQIASPADVPLQAMRLSDVTRSLAGLPTKVNIVVLDAARPNALPKMSQPLAGGLALVDPDPNMLIAFNAAPGTVAPEGKGPYGAYAQALAEMIREGGLSLDEVFDRTRLRVNEMTQGAEVPWHASKITAPFVFFDRAADAPAPKVSEAESRSNRTRAIRDFNARDAYVAALDRDTMRGYEDFLVAYPHDPMAERVRAIVAARREAITWRETWLQDTPEAYWSYLQRYPRGPHAWDARRRLEHFDAALEPPEEFTVYEYDLPPPPNASIFKNIHNTTVINTINTTIKNETVNRAAQPSAGVQLDRRTARKTTEGALGGRADALAAKVPLPPLLQKRAAKFRQATSNQQQQGALPPKPGQRVIQRQQPDTSPETSSRTGKLSTDHALPGADGKRLPLVNGKPAPDGQNLRGNKLKRQPGRQGVSGGNQEAIGNAGPDRTGKQDTDRKRGKKLRNLPAVNGMPADNGQSAREKFRQNSPKALSERSGGKPRKLTRKDLSAGQSVVETNDQGSAAASDKGRKVRKLPTVNRMPAENRPSVGERLRKNNPDVFSGDNQGSAKSKKFRRLPSVSAGPTDNGPAVQKRLRRNNPTVFSDENQGSASGNDRRRTLRRLQNEEGSAGRDVTVQRNFKVNRPNDNAQRQFRQERPNEQVLRRQRSEPRPELRSQPRPQMQERSVPREKPQRKKKLSCGQQGEPACNQ